MNKSRKVIILSILTLVMFFHSVVFADTFAIPTSAKVVVNGKLTNFEAYSIGGYNYFKLKDIAFILNGSDKQFAVNWDGTKKEINLVSGVPYSPVGSEMSTGDGKIKKAVLNTSNINKDGNPIELTAYTIGGNNFFKLKDLAQAFNMAVTWDSSTKTVGIDTSQEYVEDIYSDALLKNSTPTIEKDKYKYWGEVKDGKPHGQGTIAFYDGTSYVGEFLNGVFSGQGTLTLYEGTIYVGEFLNSVYSGQGILFSSNGDTYVGEFLNGVCHGQGTVTYSNGNTYVGEFVNSDASGQGKLTYSSGHTYVGEFLKGARNGQGKMTWTDGSTYVGEFLNNEKSGRGTYINSSGVKLVGEWLNDKAHGHFIEYDTTGKKVRELDCWYGMIIQK